MDHSTMLELFGYLGSLVVILSMLMTSVVKLRVINTVGSLMFSAYALLIHSYPTMVMNLFLAGINIWHLIRLHNTEKHYDLVRVSPKSGVLKYVLANFRDDIAAFFPGFDGEAIEDCEGFMVLCQSTPAGVFLARKTDGGEGVGEDAGEAKTLEVALDYTTPAYRDCSVGKYLYACLADMGYEQLITNVDTGVHGKYLRRMGFKDEGNSRYSLLLK